MGQIMGKNIIQDKYADLQERAEEILQCRPQELQKVPAEYIQSLIHDLQTHQIELVQGKLEKSEKNYRLLFENMYEGYAYCKMLFKDGVPQDFIYIEVNSAFRKSNRAQECARKKSQRGHTRHSKNES